MLRHDRQPPWSTHRARDPRGAAIHPSLMAKGRRGEPLLSPRDREALTTDGKPTEPLRGGIRVTADGILSAGLAVRVMEEDE